jgi:predicted Zn-dependent protease
VNSFAPRVATLAVSVLLGLGSLACTEPKTPANGVESLPPAAAQWYARAKKSLQGGDVDDARDAVQSALTAAPDSPEVKTLGARIHLARLEYGEAVRLLKGVETTEARGLRGRAHWYADELEAAADDLDLVLSDPAAKDEWAKAIARLARRGTGRKPFAMSGGNVCRSAK